MKTSLLFSLFLAAPALATEPAIQGLEGDAASDELLGDLSRDELVDRIQARAVWIPEGIGAPRSQIVNGVETDEYEQVVSLGARFGDNGAALFCSGTWITPTWVLTAGHCVDALRDYTNQGADGFVVFGGDIWAQDYFHVGNVVSFQSHPRWTGSLQGGADIALVQIDAGPRGGLQPMPLMTTSATTLRQTDTLDYVGFGITGDGRRDSGTKRTADINFYELRGDFIIGYDAEKNVCSGDSGGAALHRVGSGHELAGVNSYVFDVAGDGTSCITGASGATRIDTFLDWIATETDWQDTGGGDTGGDTGTDDTGTDPDPDPDTDVVDPADDYGDWEEPARPPEDGIAGCACSSTSTGGGTLGAMGLLGLIGLVVRRRRA